ncbi:MAG TPA: TrkA family potassium uptake protein [Anaerolineales bacterium]|nr:TrkA family potassium uptake protein [Anaerolineales bacterium]
MYVIIIGGGRTGSYLASLLYAQGHKVCVVEHHPEILASIHHELPTEIVYEGDGTDPEVLEELDIEHAHVLAAVTSDDADNLVAASLARHHYGVKRVIGRVNNPRNAWLFTPEFGVDVALNQADIMAKLIEEEMSLGDMMVMLKLRRGKYSLVEEKIFPGAYAVGVAVKDLNLPPNCIISGIIRHGEIVIPRGITTLEDGDEILALVDDAARTHLEKILGRPAEVLVD